MKVSNDKDDVIITSSLGSCLGVTLYDPVSCVGGMLHALLPQSNMNPVRANGNPHMFVDSGFETLLAAVLELGGNKKRLICKVAGGVTFLDQKRVFNTGERNFIIFRKVLWKNNIMIKGQEVGGSVPRTLILRMNDGQTLIRSRGVEVPF